MGKVIIEMETRQDAEDALKIINGILGYDKVVSVDSEPRIVTPEENEAAEEPKPKKVTKAKPAPEKVVEPEVEELSKPDTEESEKVEETGGDIDLKALTKIAKDAVDRTDRATAKDVISEYGAKLSEVDESDYTALAEKLNALGN